MNARPVTNPKKIVDPETVPYSVMVRHLPGIRSLLFILTVSLAAATGARAQSGYLGKGVSGWEVFGGYTSGWGLESGSITAGYSGDGVVDAVVTFSHLGFINPYGLDYYLQGNRVTGNAFSLMLSTYLAKQIKGEFPLSICFSGGCYMGSFSSPGSESSLASAVDNGYMTYGITVCSDFNISPTIYIQPSVGYFYSDGFGAVDEKYSRPQVGNDYVRSIIAGVSFAVRTAGTETLVFKPVVTTLRGVTLFSIGAGVVVGIGSQKAMAE